MNLLLPSLLAWIAAAPPAPSVAPPAAVTLDVPFVGQYPDTCAAAALAMVFGYWGAEVTQEEVAARLLQKELRGIRGSRLADFARERGFTAFEFAGDLAHLRDYVAKGRPLIVAWRIRKDRYHNVVVIGFDPDGDVLVVHDPAEGRARRVRARDFEKRWASAGHWTLLVLPAPR